MNAEVLAPTVQGPAADVTVVRARRPWAATHVLGLVLIVLVVGFCLLYPFAPGYAPYDQDLRRTLVAPMTDAAHLLGTDNLGRDVASRLALAGRVTLAITVGIIAVNAVLGTLIGVTAGFVGGRVDTVLSGLGDVQLALPILMIVVALSAALGPSVWLMVVVIACTYWVGYARVARSTAMSLRRRDFVLSPMIQGASVGFVLRRHVLPNVAAQVVILASSDIGAVILLTSSFDFLGLGVQPPVPSWGSMIGEGQKFLRQDLSLALVPGVAIFLVVAGTNLLSQRYTSETTHLAKRAKR